MLNIFRPQLEFKDIKKLQQVLVGNWKL